ncbi:MAG: hypothetical protein ACKO3P_05895, partial [Planctomycetaceae bacterium]
MSLSFNTYHGKRAARCQDPCRSLFVLRPLEPAPGVAAHNSPQPVLTWPPATGTFAYRKYNASFPA